eukprot:1161782-Pelagomonas_calceolata.AAC.21
MQTLLHHRAKGGAPGQAVHTQHALSADGHRGECAVPPQKWGIGCCHLRHTQVCGSAIHALLGCVCFGRGTGNNPTRGAARLPPDQGVV